MLKNIMMDSVPNLLALFSIGAFLALPSSTVSAQTLQRIQSTGEIRVCVWPEYYSISHRNPRTGELQGIDIDLSQALAQDLGVKPNYVLTNFAEFIQRLKQNDCDIAMMGVGVTEARKKEIDFSSPYLRSSIYFITTKANQTLNTVQDLDQPGIVIAVQKGTLMESFLTKDLRHADLLVVTKPGQRELEVEAGRADAFATDYPYSQRLLQNTDWARRIDPAETLAPTDYAYAVAKNDGEWLGVVDEFVARVKQDGRLKSAADKNQLAPILIRE